MKKLIMKLVEFSVNRPKLVIGLTLVITLISAVQFPKINIDTDPENMLRQDEPIRVFHREVKKIFGIEELIVLGIVGFNLFQSAFTNWCPMMMVLKKCGIK